MPGEEEKTPDPSPEEPSGDSGKAPVASSSEPAWDELTALASFTRGKRIRLGLLGRLTTSSPEIRLVDGFNFLIRGVPGRAMRYLRQAASISDALFLTGFLALRTGDLDSAEKDLTAAPLARGGIGRYFRKYGFEPELRVALRHGASCAVPLDRFGSMLMLVEISSRKPDIDRAISIAGDVCRLAPELLLARVMLAETLDLAGRSDKDTLEEVVKLGRAVENRGAVHAAMLYYKGKALRKLGIYTAALETLETAMMNPKLRTEELIKAATYEHALALEQSGNKLESRKQLEHLYAEDPEYEDIRKRLQL
ncbi:hypothetical protein JW921_09470 [Candidatus Fermentibacterales bacterium]|nr:hypothetical protein [Candidatus Fermentibacterales bacterium]